MLATVRDIFRRIHRLRFRWIREISKAFLGVVALGCLACAQETTPMRRDAGIAVVDEDAAMMKVFSLPEVQRFVSDLKRESNGKQRLSLQREQAPKLSCEAGSRECMWQFYAAIELGPSALFWHRFWVDSITGAVYVLNGNQDEAIPYEEWRKSDGVGK